MKQALALDLAGAFRDAVAIHDAIGTFQGRSRFERGAQASREPPPPRGDQHRKHRARSERERYEKESENEYGHRDQAEDRALQPVAAAVF